MRSVITTADYVTVHGTNKLINSFDQGSPSEADTTSVNQKDSSYCMETQNSLQYYLLHQNMPLVPTHSKMNPVHTPITFLSDTF
jgi:hypothetical protein